MGRATRLAVGGEDASTHDVAPGGAMTERADDLAAKMIGLVGQRLGAGEARDCEGACYGHEQH